MRSHRLRPYTRRRFLQHASLAGFASFAARPSLFAASSKPGAIHESTAIHNRAPLASNAFNTLPLGTIRPAGWLHEQLMIQATGLGGHLDETWADVGPNSGWLGGTGESWERGPYFLDGLFPLAVLLDDAGLKAKAQKYIDWTLNSQTPDGMFGPRSNNDWWPRMVMLKVLTQYGEATNDPRVIPLMTRYFAYQRRALPTRPLRDWGKYRWQDEAQTVIWLYNRTGEPELIDLLKLLHQQGYDWQAQFVNFRYTERTTKEAIGLEEGKNPDAALQTHGVNNAQALKASPVWSLVSHSAEDRSALQRQLAALDRYHGLPNGIFSADEHLAGPNPSQGIELCAVVEAMFSLEQSLAILGTPELGDRLERLAYNALPGTFTDDMWAHQYNQEPNQVECSLHHKPWTTDGPESNLYGLEPNFGCCTANFHQGWPKFTASLWMSSPGAAKTAGSSGETAGLVAAAYGPCEVHTEVGGIPVHLVEETEYPFRGTVRITVNPASPHAFSLSLRIPGWATSSTLRVNGQPQTAPAAGAFAMLQRTWRAGDTVELTFPLTPRVSRWYNSSVALERGPLVFSLPIGEDWVKLRTRDLTNDWQVYPTTPWNYAVASQPDTISVKESPLGNRPFSLKDAPVTLAVKARKLPKWEAEDGVAAAPPQSPVSSKEPEETITLVPYGAAKLRITAFPALQS